jgi:hypothetical protein
MSGINSAVRREATGCRRRYIFFKMPTIFVKSFNATIHNFTVHFTRQNVADPRKRCRCLHMDRVSL